MPSPTKAAIYARVSTSEQDTEQQVVELREAADRMRLDVARVVEETGSGAKVDRPGLLAIMEGARRRQFSALLVWKLDRLGRSLIDLVRNLDELRRLGVRVVATSQGMDLDPAKDDAAARFVSHVLGAAAEYERTLISDRTRAGLARARRQGVRLGRPRTSALLLAAAANDVDGGLSRRAACRQRGISESALRAFLTTRRNPPQPTAP